jgi:hypothetical protein
MIKLVGEGGVAGTVLHQMGDEARWMVLHILSDTCDMHNMCELSIGCLLILSSR